MPGTSKTKWAQLKVGLLAIAALVILGYLIFLMSATQGFFTSKTPVYTFLNDSQAVAEASQVTLNGINVGQVSKVELSGAPQANRFVKITMAIETRFLPSIPVDSQAELAAANLLGTKYINIKKGKSAQTIQPGAEIASSESAELEDVFRQSSATLATLQSVVTKLGDIVDQVEVGKGTIGKLFVDDALYNNFVAISAKFGSLASDLSTILNSSDNSVGKLAHDNGALYDDIRGVVTQANGVVTQIDKVVDGINSGKGTLGQLAQNPALFDQARQLLDDMHQLLAGIQAGQGTVGKLLKTDELSDEIKATMARLDMLLDKISNGQGTVARLLNDPTLFEDLDGITRETQGLIKDFRANPKKFLHVKFSIF
jgi:phospholipid/cholesterol/gamma-HCH transport system substrate-binding protein